MFSFVFQPSANRESLRDFNARLREFCAENAVVNIEACGFGDNLILQGTTAEDVEAENVPTFTATVRTLNPADKDLEEQLDGLIAQEVEKHHEDPEVGDPNVPVRFIVVPGEKRSWAIMLCINGVAEDDADDKGGGDGGGGGEGEPQSPAASPASGFGG